MKKIELVHKIASNTGIPKVDVLLIIESFASEVKKTIINGESVFIRGFGSFIVKTRAEKMGRNIKKNTAVHIPAHNIPAFKPAKEFVDKVKNGASKN